MIHVPQGEIVDRVVSAPAQMRIQKISEVPHVQQELLVVAQVPHVVGPQEPKMPQRAKVPQVPMVLLVEALQVQSNVAWRSESTLCEGIV